MSKLKAAKYRTMRSVDTAHAAGGGGFVSPTSTTPATGQPSFTLVPEAPAAPAPAEPTTPGLSEDDLNKAREEARRQEKDKLYPQIEHMKAELAELKKQREDEQAAREKAEAERKRLEEAQAKAAEEAEMSAKELLERKDAEWSQRFAQLEAEREAQAALLEQERQFAALVDFRARRMAEEADNIMPELIDLVVQGPTIEDIEASIAGLKDRTARIVEQARAGAQQARAAMPGSTVTAPPVGPMEIDSSQGSMPSAEQIRGMSFDDYLKNREKLLGAASAARRNSGGLFG